MVDSLSGDGINGGFGEVDIIAVDSLFDLVVAYEGYVGDEAKAWVVGLMNDMVFNIRLMDGAPFVADGRDVAGGVIV